MIARTRRHYALSWPRFQASVAVRLVADLVSPAPSGYTRAYILAYLEADASLPDIGAMDALVVEARALTQPKQV